MIQNKRIQNEISEFADIKCNTAEHKLLKSQHGQNSLQKVAAVWRRLMWSFADAWYG